MGDSISAILRTNHQSPILNTTKRTFTTYRRKVGNKVFFRFRQLETGENPCRQLNDEGDLLNIQQEVYSFTKSQKPTRAIHEERHQTTETAHNCVRFPSRYVTFYPGTL